MRSYILAAVFSVAVSAHNHPGSTVTKIATATVTSCSSDVVSCPGRSTSIPSIPAVPVSSPSVTTIDIYSTTSICPESSTIHTALPISTAPAPITNSTIVVPPPASSSIYSAPVVSSSSSVPAPPASSSVAYTVLPITTCIPTTLWTTVPVTVSTPVLPTTIASGGFATGTGVIPSSSPSPITPVIIGAASSFSGSYAAAGVMVIAAFFF